MVESQWNILYLHGLSGNPRGTKWQKLAAQFGADRVIAPSLRFDEGALSEDDTDDWQGEADRLFRAFADGVDIAQRAFDECRPDVVVGSSFGGGVALQMDVGGAALVLIAPCWGYETLRQLTQLHLAQRFPSVAKLPTAEVDQAVTPFVPEIDAVVDAATLIVHSPQDELIPFDDSREIVRRSDLAPDRLIEAGANHGMSDDEAAHAILAAVQRQLDDRQLRANARTDTR